MAINSVPFMGTLHEPQSPFALMSSRASFSVVVELLAKLSPCNG